MPKVEWSHLKVLPATKVISSMYIWLFVVPVLARTLGKIQGSKTLALLGSYFPVNLSLPFTWQVFYFSAILFTLANLVYWMRCPKIIKDHTNAAEFLAEGKGWPQLLRYQEDARLSTEKFKEEHQFAKDNIVEVDTRYHYLFWKIYDHANTSRVWSLLACAILYAAGLVLIAYVFVENFWAVVSPFFGEDL